ncbi:MAG: hypothetical protein FWE09_09875 [Treponema sp.]|nr:hypothetical protein [Treponema sp.]
MGRIKSALELALERSESIPSDKASVGLFQARQEGTRLANAFLAGEAGADIEAELKKRPKEQQGGLRQGIVEALIPQIGLPASEADIARVEAACSALGALVKDARLGAMLPQVGQLLSAYLDDLARFDEAIRKQYAPKLRAKEEELSRRMGREVRLDPFQDQEFLEVYSQSVSALKANYQEPLDQLREEALRAWAEQGGG